MLNNALGDFQLFTISKLPIAAQIKLIGNIQQGHRILRIPSIPRGLPIVNSENWSEIGRRQPLIYSEPHRRRHYHISIF